jgi:D-alanine-D-alanine ligase
VKVVAKLRTHLVVIFGGRSAEHDVSCRTAWHVAVAIDRSLHDVTVVGITKEGQWNHVSDPFSAANQNLADDGHLSTEGVPVNPFDLVADLSASSTEQIVVLPLLHGPLGEDGTIQGLLEVLDVAYVGSGVLGSALAMDKSMAKTVAASAGIPIPRYLTLKSADLHEMASITQRVEHELDYPCFVKPANMGSSVGVSRVQGPQDLAAAVELAFTFDSSVLVEEGIHGREIEVAVLGNESPVAFPPGEVIPADKFYSYSDKYIDGNSTCEIPAQLPDGVITEVADLAVRVFSALGCSGLARCDFFFEEHGRGVLFNELNTMPGFTPISMYPKMVTASGMTYATLINNLVDLAIERHSSRVRNTAH